MNELLVLENKNMMEVFTRDGVDPILDAIKKEVENIVPDLTTSNGRKSIASLSRKVASTKVYLDNKGKELTSEWKQKALLVDEARKKISRESAIALGLIK